MCDMAVHGVAGQRSFQRLLNKEEGARAEWEYPFAVGGLNVTFMLIQLLDLRAPIPNSLAGRRFVGFLEGMGGRQQAARGGEIVEGRGVVGLQEMRRRLTICTVSRLR